MMRQSTWRKIGSTKQILYQKFKDISRLMKWFLKMIKVILFFIRRLIKKKNKKKIKHLW